MSIPHRCTNASCATTLQIPDGAVGKEVRCPLCGHLQTIPRSRSPAAPRSELSQAVTSEPTALAEEEILDVLPVHGDGITRIPGLRRIQEDDDNRHTRQHRDRFQEESCPFCQAEVEEDARLCLFCGRRIDDHRLNCVFQGLRKQRARNQLLSFLFGLPGIGMVVGGYAFEYQDPGLGVLMAAGGYVLFCVGIGYAVAYKRYNLVWLLLVFLGLVGLIILAILPDEKRKVLARIRRRLVARSAFDG